MFFGKNFFSVKNKKNNGFSLVELIVTMGIFMIITSVVFINYPEFRSKISLKRAAQGIALSVRQAQAYGLAVRGFQKDGVTIYPGYGAHFDKNSTEYLVFADDPSEGYGGNGIYSDGSNAGTETDGIVETFSLESGDLISDIYGCDDEDGINCDDVEILDAVYLRPSPTITLKGCGAYKCYDFDGYAAIKVESPQGETKLIKVYPSGQISIEE